LLIVRIHTSPMDEPPLAVRSGKQCPSRETLVLTAPIVTPD
jgi:hypothetical protein